MFSSYNIFFVKWYQCYYLNFNFFLSYVWIIKIYNYSNVQLFKICDVLLIISQCHLQSNINFFFLLFYLFLFYFSSTKRPLKSTLFLFYLSLLINYLTYFSLLNFSSQPNKALGMQQPRESRHLPTVIFLKGLSAQRYTYLCFYSLTIFIFFIPKKEWLF